MPSADDEPGIVTGGGRSTVSEQHSTAGLDAPESVGSPSGIRTELLVVAALLFVSSAFWAISSPMMSAPDEPAHATKAAGAWQGDLLGAEVQYPPNPGEKRGPIVYRVEAPESYASANATFMCFALKPTVTADCAPDLLDSQRVVEVETAAGSYPPLYYLLVGWPSRLISADVGLYVMRLISAAIAVGFFTLGYWAVRRICSRPLAAIALLVGVTPQVLFLNGSISPNSLEVAAAFALWASFASLVLTWRRDEPLDRGLVAATILSAVILTNTRPLSVLFLFMIAGIVLFFAGWTRIRELAVDRRWWAIVATIGLGAVPAALWALNWGQAGSATGGGIISTEPNIVLTLVASSDDWFAQMIAQFGWLDTGPVLVAVWVWLVLAAVIVALAAGSGGAWRSSVVVLVVAFIVSGPVILQYPSAREGHVVWQGRYFLAIAMGVPVLAALTFDRRRVARQMTQRVFTAMAVLAGVGVVASHMAAMRRYMVGTGGRLNYLSGGSWQPPVSPWILLVGTLGVAVGVAVLMARISGNDGPLPPLRRAVANDVTADSNELAPVDGDNDEIDMRSIVSLETS